MHHLVTQFSDRHPLVGRYDPSQAFGTIQIVELRTCLFTQGGQQSGEQFVGKGILQSAETTDEGFDPFGKVRGVGERISTLCRHWRGEQAAVGRFQMATFFLDYAGKEAKTGEVGWRHNATPSRLATA